MYITKVYPNAIIPKYQTDGAAGVDLHAAQEGRINPGCQCKVGTGIAIAIPKNHEGQVRPRSGLGLQGITCHLGTIDSDYRGEISVVLMNIGRKVFTWKIGDRIAQLVISPIKRVRFDEVPELDPTQRGKGGFGHTGM